MACSTRSSFKLQARQHLHPLSICQSPCLDSQTTRRTEAAILTYTSHGANKDVQTVALSIRVRC